MAKITIENGPMTRQVDVEEGTTLGQLKAELGDRFSITKEHTANVSGGGTLNDDSVLEGGQTIRFNRNVGQKG